MGAAGGGCLKTALTVAGQAVPHESAREHVTGEALYTDDLLLRFPNPLHAWPVLSPHAHALVKSLDVSAALSEPGVATVLTAEDVPGEGDSGSNRHDEPLFPTEVLYHSQPVAWVLGETLDAAQRGAGKVSVDYEVLPAILTIEDAILAGSFHSPPLRLARGDISVIESSALRFEGELQIGGQEHFYLETQCALAWMDETGGVAAHSSTQHPTETQEVIARVLGIPRNRVTVECVRMGGAFGGKEVQANPYAAIAALGAWKTRRPVRVRLTRALDFALTGKRHPFLARYLAGFTAEGRLEGVRIALYSDGGWSLDLSEPVLSRAMFHCDNAYLLPAVEVTGLICRTHKTSQTAFRGFGGPQGMLVIEEILDQAARRLGLPPDIVRERNFYRDGDTTHYGQPVKDAGRIEIIWRRLKESSGFVQRREQIEHWNARHPHHKRGLAITPVKFGISFTATFFNQAGALVLIYRDGSVQVNHGGAEMGQGLHTKIQQIAAESLGLDLEAVRVMSTRTDKIPNTSATAASAGADLNGAAVADACSELRSRLAEVAAVMLGCDFGAVEFSRGLCIPQGRAAASDSVCESMRGCLSPASAAVRAWLLPDARYSLRSENGARHAVPLLRLCRRRIRGGSGRLHWRLSPAANRHPRRRRRFGFAARGSRANRGRIHSRRWMVDAGRTGVGFKRTPGHRGRVHLQIAVLDRSAGCLRSRLSGTSGASPAPSFGSKAVGEPPLMLAISVREALRDAIAAFGAGGPILLESPATPERVFFAVQRARAERESHVSSVGARR